MAIQQGLNAATTEEARGFLLELEYQGSSGKVLILGGIIVGTQAAKMAAGLGQS
jgi:alanine dehydrogenase